MNYLKKNIYAASYLFVLCATFLGTGKIYAQRDTLHIYYKALQPEIVDSNDTKIGNWAKTLKGKHVDVEIFTYYDAADFKKYMVERAENLNMIVIRKARDYVTITSSKAVRGKKSQRSVADIVYTRIYEKPVDPPATEQPATEQPTEQKNESGTMKSDSTNTQKPN